MELCSGYSDSGILDKVRQSAGKVRDNEAAYERDSVLFPAVHYSLPLLSFLLYAASRSGNQLNLIDFGGALGSTFYQNKKFIKHLEVLNWNIIEQEHFVVTGRKEFQTKSLKFFFTMEESLSQCKSEILLLSSVLPYIADPYQLLRNAMLLKFRFVIIDRTPFLSADFPDRLTIETVPPIIYKAKYPAWFLNKNKFLDFMQVEYELFQEFESWESWDLADTKAQSMAFLFIRKSND